MKEVLIDRQIGSDFWEEGITADFVRNELNAAGDDDIRITIDSPGGSVWDCISIYNTIRDFCRNHSNKVDTYIVGMAASSASVIALAASSVNPENKIIVEDNSVYMIHKVWQVVIGNEEDMSEASEAMKKLDNLFAAAYSKKTGRDNKQLLKEMGAETWLYGEEIVKEGFADEVVSANGNTGESEENVLTLAKAKVTTTQGQMKAMSAKEFMGKIAACVKCAKMEIPGGKKPVNNNSAKAENGGLETMTAEEFKKANPDEYNQIVAKAKEDGVQEERARASSLLKMGEVAGCPDVAAAFVRDGSAVSDNAVQEKFFERRIAKATLDAQAKDEADIPNVTPPKDGGEADENDIMAAFNKEIGA